MTDLQIADALRALVRSRLLYGWRSCVWHDRMWTIVTDGHLTQDYDRDGIVAFIRLAGDVAAWA